MEKNNKMKKTNLKERRIHDWSIYRIEKSLKKQNKIDLELLFGNLDALIEDRDALIRVVDSILNLKAKLNNEKNN